MASRPRNPWLFPTLLVGSLISGGAAGAALGFLILRALSGQ